MIKIHFLNVGHGDCTIIEHRSDRLTMIDINNSKSLDLDQEIELAKAHGLSFIEFKSAAVAPGGRSWSDYYESLLVDPYDFYADHYPGRSIFRYIQTHPDMDHMGGLHRFFWEEKVPLENTWDTDHAKQMAKDDFTSSPYEYDDWVVYQRLREGHGPDDRGHNVLRLEPDAVGDYYAQDGIQILSPTPELVGTCDSNGRSWNDASYVLKISHAGRSIILPGDAETAAWDSICDRYPSAALSCDLLKASHHGRESGFHLEAVKAMNPDVVLCSVGKKPATDASNRYANLGARVLSTRANGTITVTIWDDGDLWVEDHEGNRLVTLERGLLAS